jgi:uncharacterized low-complexity protein
MSKMRKLLVTAAALAALAVGGAAFAQAQNAGTVAKVTAQRPPAETSQSADTDNVQVGDQSESDQGSQAGEHEDGPESQTEAPDTETND